MIPHIPSKPSHLYFNLWVVLVGPLLPCLSGAFLHFPAASQLPKRHTPGLPGLFSLLVSWGPWGPHVATHLSRRRRACADLLTAGFPRVSTVALI